MLELRSVSRRFGDRTVVDDVSFTVGPGRLTGFVGANGAGKTTTMRIVLGVLAADRGEVHWQGRPITTGERRRFGYMPEERGLYPKMKVADQITYFGQLHGMSRRDAAASTSALLEQLSLDDRSNDTLESLSLGNQQRAQIAAALVHDPIALILDEPFSGLDPLAVDTVVSVLRERAARGVPVLFSSHQLDVVERLCDDVVVIAGGRVAAAGERDQLRHAHAGLRYRLTVDPDAGWLRDWAAANGMRVVDIDGPRAVIELSRPDLEQPLLTEALRRGPVREFAPVVPTLSQIFREVIR
ncbi:ABC transporter ATP-binding protein [Nakamurella deserti]|uniref:ABC transporter ATP-binding protein n=1 Tax=Nakamurella deserti TaxID=2164074 RepID=UPI000DBE40AB|nr:ATP-binding cassette domain-containing protein [Nakamurella deserti]